MGYDEPSSKRPPVMRDTEATHSGRAGRWVRHLLLALVALGLGVYVAINPDMQQNAPDWMQKTAKQVAGYTTVLTNQAQTGGGRAGRSAAGAPAPVRVATAELRDVPVRVHTIGTVLANSTVVIKSQVDGPLQEAFFREGQMVKKGDLLFRIDPAPFEAALRQSQAQVQRDRAQLASAQADADRAVMLSQRGIVSDQQRDQLVANANALKATIAADEAALERAQLNLGYTTIRAPINGKTGPFLVFPGNQVHANDTTGMINITEIQPVKITFNLPQGDLPQLQDRMKERTLVASVMIRSDVAAAVVDQSSDEIPIKVDYVGNAVDDRTGTIELRATFDNPDLRFVPGELVNVNVRLATLKNAIVVPREAVNVGQNGNYVFVIDAESKGQMRPVTVLYQDQTTAALGSGVQAGDRVVTDGQLRLTPGVGAVIIQPEGRNGTSRDAPSSGLSAVRSEDPAADAVKVSNPEDIKAGDATAAPERHGG